MAYESYCASCTYMKESGSQKYWCEKKGSRRLASDSRCSSWCEAYGRSGSARENMFDCSSKYTPYNTYDPPSCYITTIMCQILDRPDDDSYLQTLRMFRDNVMKKNINYIPLLVTYDFVGPMIAEKLANDEDNEEIARTMFETYITKAVDAINEGKIEFAINIYKSMTICLAEKYNINMNIIMPNIDDIDMRYLGHGKKKAYIKSKKEFSTN